MDTQNNYTETSYRVSKIILFLLTFAAITIMVNIQPSVSRYLFGLPILFSGILGLYGSYFLFKGYHEPFNEKKVIAVTVNLAMVLLMLTILVSNTIY
jgi:uncharacterized PurR-regulated membrane protein YhhQ (DUF165 family)